MTPFRKALYLILPLLVLMLILLALSSDSSRQGMLRFFQIVKQGLNDFEYLPGI